jgi:enoyl-CoA hydratase/carnithine racemase
MVDARIEGGIARIFLNRPEKVNALDSALLHDLLEALRRVPEFPEVRLGIPAVVEAALLPRLLGSGRAAWLVLTGEAIGERRAYEWGLIEAIGADAELQSILEKVVAADREALRVQKALLHLWEEAPLADSIAKSVECFAHAYAKGAPQNLIGKLRR